MIGRKKEFAVCSCHHHCPRFPYHAPSNATETQLHCKYIPGSLALVGSLSHSQIIVPLDAIYNCRVLFRFGVTFDSIIHVLYICIFYYSLPFTDPRFREEKLVRRLRVFVLFFSEDVPSGCTTSKADFMPSPKSHSGISS